MMKKKLALLISFSLLIPFQAISIPLASAESLQSTLNQLKIFPEKSTGYSRNKFGSSWKTVSSKCDIRETLLIQQSEISIKKDSNCKVLDGEWIDFYSSEIITEPIRATIDHVVSL